MSREGSALPAPARWGRGPQTPFAWQLDQQASIPSTQDAAIAAAHAGHPGRLIVIASQQTKGRGRDGRVWASPPGNLYASFLLRPGATAPLGAYWAQLAALALHDAIGIPCLTIKPPNDILLHGAKLAGILVDTALTPHGTPDWVVIGIGVNTLDAPFLPDRTTASLDGRVAPKALSLLVAEQLDHWLARRPQTVEQTYQMRVWGGAPQRGCKGQSPLPAGSR